MGTPRCGCPLSKQGKQEEGSLTSHGRCGPNAPEVLVLPPQSHLVLQGEKGAESCGARPPVARGQPGDVGSSPAGDLKVSSSSGIIARGSALPWITVVDHPASPRWVQPPPLHPSPAQLLPGTQRSICMGWVLCWLSPRATSRRLEGTRVAGGMAGTCRRLSEPTEAAGLSLASSPNADKSPWASSHSGGVITEPKGGTKPYLLHHEALFSEVREVPAPCQRSGIVLSGLQEIQPVRGEALRLKPLGSA